MNPLFLATLTANLAAKALIPEWDFSMEGLGDDACAAVARAINQPWV
jgi:hypothetical protein